MTYLITFQIEYPHTTHLLQRTIITGINPIDWYLHREWVKEIGRDNPEDKCVILCAYEFQG